VGLTLPTFEITVSGRVQGVGFRAYVVGVATDMGVTGEVWNTLDQRVSILATHSDPEALHAFVEALSDGPGRPDFVHAHQSADRPATARMVIGTTR